MKIWVEQGSRERSGEAPGKLREDVSQAAGYESGGRQRGPGCRIYLVIGIQTTSKALRSDQEEKRPRKGGPGRSHVMVGGMGGHAIRQGKGGQHRREGSHGGEEAQARGAAVPQPRKGGCKHGPCPALPTHQVRGRPAPDGWV